MPSDKVLAIQIRAKLDGFKRRDEKIEMLEADLARADANWKRVEKALREMTTERNQWRGRAQGRGAARDYRGGFDALDMS